MANEEILSSNEELQSTNEELETAKEELQSMNEELSTANEGMRKQNLAMGLANSDLNNLFSSASLPMLMVGSDLRIRRFTRLVEKVLSIIPSDVGRPLRDFQFNLHLPNLDSLLSEVISTGVFKEWEVQDLKGHWYSIRIQPYKTDEGKAEGAVRLTFIDIDSFKGVEKLTKGPGGAPVRPELQRGDRADRPGAFLGSGRRAPRDLGEHGLLPRLPNLQGRDGGTVHLQPRERPVGHPSFADVPGPGAIRN